MVSCVLQTCEVTCVYTDIHVHEQCMLHERFCVYVFKSLKPCLNLCTAAAAVPVICKPCCVLQEVQSNHFDNFLAPELQKAGYTAIYKRKTTELYTGTSYAIDGCATFFKRDKFALVKKYEVWSDLRIIHARRCNANKCNALQDRQSYKRCSFTCVLCQLLLFHVQVKVCCKLVAKLLCAGIVMHSCSKYTLAKQLCAANAIHAAHAMHAVNAMQNGSQVYAGNIRSADSSIHVSCHCIALKIPKPS